MFGGGDKASGKKGSVSKQVTEEKKENEHGKEVQQISWRNSWGEDEDGDEHDGEGGVVVEPVNKSEQEAGEMAPDVMMRINWASELVFRSSNSRG